MATPTQPRCVRISAFLSDPSPHELSHERVNRGSYWTETRSRSHMATVLPLPTPASNLDQRDEGTGQTQEEVNQLDMSATPTVAELARLLVEEKNPGEWLLRICNRSTTRYATSQSRTVWISYGDGVSTMIRINPSEEEEEEEGCEEEEEGWDQVSVSLHFQGDLLDPTSPVMDHLSQAGPLTREAIPLIISTGEGPRWPTKVGEGKTHSWRVWENERRPGVVKRMDFVSEDVEDKRAAVMERRGDGGVSKRKAATICTSNDDSESEGASNVNPKQSEKGPTRKKAKRTRSDDEEPPAPGNDTDEEESVSTKRKSVAGTPSESSGSDKKQIRRPRFTEAEKATIKCGVEKFGPGKWTEIKAHYPVELRNRNATSIRDCYRAMLKKNEI